MTEMTPELKQHYADSLQLLRKVCPSFVNQDSFVVMCVLSNLIAQWLVTHHEDQHNDLIAILAATVEDDIANIYRMQDEETLH